MHEHNKHIDNRVQFILLDVQEMMPVSIQHLKTILKTSSRTEIN